MPTIFKKAIQNAQDLMVFLKKYQLLSNNFKAFQKYILGILDLAEAFKNHNFVKFSDCEGSLEAILG